MEILGVEHGPVWGNNTYEQVDCEKLDDILVNLTWEKWDEELALWKPHLEEDDGSWWIFCLALAKGMGWLSLVELCL